MTWRRHGFLFWAHLCPVNNLCFRPRLSFLWKLRKQLPLHYIASKDKKKYSCNKLDPDVNCSLAEPQLKDTYISYFHNLYPFSKLHVIDKFSKLNCVSLYFIFTSRIPFSYIHSTSISYRRNLYSFKLVKTAAHTMWECYIGSKCE